MDYVLLISEIFAYPAIALVFILLANKQISLLINPPLQKELSLLEGRLEKTRQEMTEIKSNVNTLMLDKGFKK